MEAVVPAYRRVSRCSFAGQATSCRAGACDRGGLQCAVAESPQEVELELGLGLSGKVLFGERELEKRREDVWMGDGCRADVDGRCLHSFVTPSLADLASASSSATQVSHTSAGILRDQLHPLQGNIHLTFVNIHHILHAHNGDKKHNNMPRMRLSPATTDTQRPTHCAPSPQSTTSIRSLLRAYHNHAVE